MEKIKELLSNQIEHAISAYNPFLEVLSEEEKNSLNDLKQCLQILQKP